METINTKHMILNNKSWHAILYKFLYDTEYMPLYLIEYILKVTLSVIVFIILLPLFIIPVILDGFSSENGENLPLLPAAMVGTCIYLAVFIICSMVIFPIMWHTSYGETIMEVSILTAAVAGYTAFIIGVIILLFKNVRRLLLNNIDKFNHRIYWE
jgi:hypothetical protein